MQISWHKPSHSFKKYLLVNDSDQRSLDIISCAFKHHKIVCAHQHIHTQSGQELLTALV